MDSKVEPPKQNQLPEIFTEEQERRIREIIKEEIHFDQLNAFDMEPS